MSCLQGVQGGLEVQNFQVIVHVEFTMIHCLWATHTPLGNPSKFIWLNKQSLDRIFFSFGLLSGILLGISSNLLPYPWEVTHQGTAILLPAVQNEWGVETVTWSDLTRVQMKCQEQLLLIHGQINNLWSSEPGPGIQQILVPKHKWHSIVKSRHGVFYIRQNQNGSWWRKW